MLCVRIGLCVAVTSLKVYITDHHVPQHGWQEHLQPFSGHSGTSCFVLCDQAEMFLVDAIMA